jgi:hypothetical protein
MSSAIVNLCDDEAEEAAALAQVMELGISRGTALAALKLSQGNVARAIEHVFAEPPAAAAPGGTSTGSAMSSFSSQAPPEALRQCRSCETYAPADSMQILEACNHMLCRQCIRPLQQQQLQQPTHPVCPARSCSRPLAIRDLALLLPPRALETLQSSALANFKQRLAEGFRCKQCSTVLQPSAAAAAAAAAADSSNARTVAELQVKHMLTCRCGRTACCVCRESITAAAATPSTHSCTYSNLAVLLQLLTELELLVPDPDSTASASRRAASSSTAAAAAAAAATTSKAPAAKRAKAKAAPPKPANTWAWGSPFSYASGIPASVFTGAIYDDYGKLTTICPLPVRILELSAL